IVSKASDDLPEPESPVITTSWSRGISRSTFLRLCSRAPRMTIRSLAIATYYTARGPRQGRGGERRVGPHRAGPPGQVPAVRGDRGERDHTDERADQARPAAVAGKTGRHDRRRRQPEPGEQDSRRVAGPRHGGAARHDQDHGGWVGEQRSHQRRPEREDARLPSPRTVERRVEDIAQRGRGREKQDEESGGAHQG